MLSPFLKQEDLESKIQKCENDIKELYFQTNYDIFIGWSGGKDSSVVLNLFLTTLGEINASTPKKIKILCVDTLVENPIFEQYIKENISLLQNFITSASLPFEILYGTPRLNDRFWINLIGKGYAPPKQRFRWCSKKLKINTMTRQIIENSKKDGKFLLCIGVRKDESSSRAASIESFSSHSPFSKINLRGKTGYIWRLIQDWSLQDVWDYLKKYKLAWGDENLRTLYQHNAASRMGCWVCTLVKKDVSLENAIRLNPDISNLLHFKQGLLKTAQNHRTYKVYNTEIIRGKINFFYREFLLERLKKLQKQVPKMKIISPKEIREIYKIWNKQLNQMDLSESRIPLKYVYRTVNIQ